MKSYSPREVIKILEDNGWYLKKIEGGHYIYKKNGEKILVVVSISKKTIPIGTLKSIEKQSKIKFE